MPNSSSRATARKSDPPTFTTVGGRRGAIRFGRYTIIGELARGGMGKVYLCVVSGSAGFRRLYALKMVHEHLAQESEVVDMILDEARIASRIYHSNVVPIVDLGIEEGRHYVIMDYIEGCSLGQLCRRQPEERPPWLLVPLMLDTLAGLHAAHSLADDDGKSLQLVHRDVSPDNVLVGVDGVARVIDFGIAKATSRRSSTREGSVKGKLAYLSPEQIIDSSPVDARSDVFSAGVTLWTLLTGLSLFKGKTDGATIHAVLNRAVPPPSTVGLRPPECLDAICLRALQRGPDARYQSAAEMADALRRVAEDNKLLGQRDEIARWIKNSFSKELAARREAVRRCTEELEASEPIRELSELSKLTSLPSLGDTHSKQISVSAQGLIPLSSYEPIDPTKVVNQKRASWQKRALVIVPIALVTVAGAVALLRSGDDATPQLAPTSAASTTAAPTAAPSDSAEPQAPEARATASAGTSASASAGTSASAAAGQSAQPAATSRPPVVQPRTPPQPPKPAPSGGRDVGY